MTANCGARSRGAPVRDRLNGVRRELRYAHNLVAPRPVTDGPYPDQPGHRWNSKKGDFRQPHK